MSFAKTVSAGGSGGAVVLPSAVSTDSPENWLRSSLITEMSAIVGLDSLEALEDLVARRARVAEVYTTELTEWLVPQRVRDGDRHSWVHWTATVDPAVGRDRLVAALRDEGVMTLPYYEQIAGAARPPRSSWLHEQALALPMSSELSMDQAERVAAGVRRAVRRWSELAGLVGCVDMRLRPARLNTTIAWLFVVGSALFVLGSVPAYVNAVGGTVDSVTYFVGLGVLHLCLVRPARPGPESGHDRRTRRAAGPAGPARLHAWLPHDRGWLAAATQFPGTLFFNISTLAALAHNATVKQEDRHVWRPDFFGSTLFLVASVLAILALGGGSWPSGPDRCPGGSPG